MFRCEYFRLAMNRDLYSVLDGAFNTVPFVYTMRPFNSKILLPIGNILHVFLYAEGRREYEEGHVLRDINNFYPQLEHRILDARCYCDR